MGEPSQGAKRREHVRRRGGFLGARDPALQALHANLVGHHALA